MLCQKALEHSFDLSALKQISAKTSNGLFLDKRFWIHRWRIVEYPIDIQVTYKYDLAK